MKVKVTNGISFNKSYVVTDDDVTAGKVEFEFVGNALTAPNFDMVFIVQILRGDAVATGDAKVTIDGNLVTVEDGATYVLTEDDVINVIAGRNV